MTTKIHSQDMPSAVAVDSPLTPACVRTTIIPF